MLSVVMLSVVMLSVVMLSDVMLGVVAPLFSIICRAYTTQSCRVALNIFV